METTSKQPATPADLIVVDAKVTTLAADGSEARALAVKGEQFLAVGDESEVMRFPRQRHPSRQCARPPGHPRTQRLSSARRARRAALQP